MYFDINVSEHSARISLYLLYSICAPILCKVLLFTQIELQHKLDYFLEGISLAYIRIKTVDVVHGDKIY